MYSTLADQIDSNVEFLLLYYDVTSVNFVSDKLLMIKW